MLIFCCKYASVLFKSLFATLIPKNMQNKKMMKFYFVNGSIVVGSVSVFIGSTIQIDNPDHHLNQSSVTCQPDPTSGLSSFIWIVISGCWSAIIGSAIISLRFVVVGCNILNAWSPYFQKYSTCWVLSPSLSLSNLKNLKNLKKWVCAAAAAL